MENTIEVTGCGDCPFHREHDRILMPSIHFCHHPMSTNSDESTKRLLKYCPLKNSPVTIKLKHNDRTES